MKGKFSVTGISFDGSQRLTSFIALLEELGGLFSTSASLLTWQPDIPLNNRKQKLRLILTDIYFTRLRYRSMFRQYESILKVPLFTRMKREAAHILRLPLVLQYFNKSYRDNRVELRSREAFLNLKHRLAWLNFLSGDGEILLVLEDDAMPTDLLWKDKLLSELMQVSTLTPKPVLLNLAPFFDIETLLPELLLPDESSPADWKRFTFYANTTAAYIVNRSGAEKLLDGFFTSPILNLESIDFAMNMAVINNEFKVLYFERDPILFNNSSQAEGWSSLGNFNANARWLMPRARRK